MNFNPRPPRGGRLGYAIEIGRKLVISIHAPCEGGDQDGSGDRRGNARDFNPRPLRGGRHYTTDKQVAADYISIHAPREGGDGVNSLPFRGKNISIHAPREGGDVVYIRMLDDNS